MYASYFDKDIMHVYGVTENNYFILTINHFFANHFRLFYITLEIRQNANNKGIQFLFKLENKHFLAKNAIV